MINVKKKNKLRKGYKAGGRTYKVHIDGYNLLSHLTGKAKESPRRLFAYPMDAGEVACIRYDDWKLVYMERRTKNFDI